MCKRHGGLIASVITPPDFQGHQFMPFAKSKILNVSFDNITQQELLGNLDHGVVVTPNIDHLMKLQKDQAFYECYQQADYTVCDSRIIFALSKLLFSKSALREQITGSDFFPAFCEHHKENETISIFLLGGTETSVVAAMEKINNRAEREIVAGAYSPPFGFERDEKETQIIIDRINDSGATVLAIGVGAPKQEKWLFAHKHRLPNVRIHLAIGATIEFEAGNLKRSPKWMTKCGLEWIYRLAQEPKRLAKRYLLEDMPFFALLIKQKLGMYKNPWS